MGDENQATIGPGVFVTIFGIIIAVISVVVTLLLHNMQEVSNKADKTDASDRWTGRMEQIQQQCEIDKEFLRDEREKQRDTSAHNARDALAWKAKYETCHTAWELHKAVCKCNHTGGHQ